ncbi:MAG: GNAT family N-acetyltransferase [Oscillospiraceae bacterium]|nr:GNAT family N-acetyltransferase [Oscillospiraceae bacterium]
MAYEILKLRDCPQWLDRGAAWFHAKWGVPLEAYRESMAACVNNLGAIPQWYLAVDGNAIVGGLGVIENDFHNRPDLAPNVCAVYVEESHRCQGVAGALLNCVCADMAALGVDTLYLLTDHTAFYERYGWQFLCMAQGEGDAEPSRMYIRHWGA